MNEGSGIEPFRDEDLVDEEEYSVNSDTDEELEDLTKKQKQSTTADTEDVHDYDADDKSQFEQIQYPTHEIDGRKKKSGSRTISTSIKGKGRGAVAPAPAVTIDMDREIMTNVEIDDDDGPIFRCFSCIWTGYGFVVLLLDYLTDLLTIPYHFYKENYWRAVLTFLIILFAGVVGSIGFTLRTSRKYKDFNFFFGKKWIYWLKIPTLGSIVCTFRSLQVINKPPEYFGHQEHLTSYVGGYRGCKQDLESLSKWFKMIETMFEAAPQAILIVNHIIISYDEIIGSESPFWRYQPFVTMAVSFIGLGVNINNFWILSMPHLYDTYDFINPKFWIMRTVLFFEAFSFLGARFLLLNMAAFAFQTFIPSQKVLSTILLVTLIILPRLIAAYLDISTSPSPFPTSDEDIQIIRFKRDKIFTRYLYSIIFYPVKDYHTFPFYLFVESFLCFAAFYYAGSCTKPFWLYPTLLVLSSLWILLFIGRRIYHISREKGSKNPAPLIHECEQVVEILDKLSNSPNQQLFKDLFESLTQLKIKISNIYPPALKSTYSRMNSIKSTRSSRTRVEDDTGTIVKRALSFYRCRGKFLDLSKSTRKITFRGEVCYCHFSINNTLSYTILYSISKLFSLQGVNNPYRTVVSSFPNIISIPQDTLDILEILSSLICTRKILDNAPSPVFWANAPTFDFKMTSSIEQFHSNQIWTLIKAPFRVRIRKFHQQQQLPLLPLQSIKNGGHHNHNGHIDDSKL